MDTSFCIIRARDGNRMFKVYAAAEAGAKLTSTGCLDCVYIGFMI